MIAAKKHILDELIETYLPNLAGSISRLPLGVKDKVQEIRIRINQAVTLELGYPEGRMRIDKWTSKSDINEYIKRFCDYSVHSFEKQFSEGFITLRGGHRAGFSGTAVIRGDRVETVRDISSINLRVAKEYIGSSDILYKRLFTGKSDMQGLIIIGKPLSAKTTVLRDLIRNISMHSKVTVIDERGEIAAVSGGVINSNLGLNTDVLDGFPKGQGFMNALRALSPEYIAFDELGFDVSILHDCANCGVKTIMTAHSSGIDEFRKNGRLKEVLDTGIITHIAQLGSGKEIGQLIGFYKAADL